MSTLELGHVDTPDGFRIVHQRRGGRPRLVVPSASWMAADLDGLLPDEGVLFYDLRGRGRSSALHDEANLGLDKDLADLLLLMDDQGIERTSLLGWSYHGLLAASFALAHPERVEKLVLVGSVAPRAQPHFDHFLETFATRVDLEALTELTSRKRAGAPAAEWGRDTHRLFFRAYAADPASVEHLRSNPAVAPNEDADRVNDQGRRVLQKLGDFDWRERFRHLETPTLILHGERDPVPLAGAREWLACLPNATLEVLGHAGHLPWVEQAEAWRASVEAFLA